MKEYIIKVDDDISKRDINGDMPLLEPPQELIRCKDCLYGAHVKNGAGDVCVQCNNDELQMFGDVHFPDWFCADGKRTTE